MQFNDILQYQLNYCKKNTQCDWDSNPDRTMKGADESTEPLQPALHIKD